MTETEVKKKISAEIQKMGTEVVYHTQAAQSYSVPFSLQKRSAPKITKKHNIVKPQNKPPTPINHVNYQRE